MSSERDRSPRLDEAEKYMRLLLEGMAFIMYLCVKAKPDSFEYTKSLHASA